MGAEILLWLYFRKCNLLQDPCKHLKSTLVYHSPKTVISLPCETLHADLLGPLLVMHFSERDRMYFSERGLVNRLHAVRKTGSVTHISLNLIL